MQNFIVCDHEYVRGRERGIKQVDGDWADIKLLEPDDKRW
jgi:hypothetical protein